MYSLIEQPDEVEGAEAGGAAQGQAPITMELERQTQAGTSGTPGSPPALLAHRAPASRLDHPPPLPCHVPSQWL